MMHKIETEIQEGIEEARVKKEKRSPLHRTQAEFLPGI